MKDGNKAVNGVRGRKRAREEGRKKDLPAGVKAKVIKNNY